jgi:hypothetical protein
MSEGVVKRRSLLNRLAALAAAAMFAAALSVSLTASAAAATVVVSGDTAFGANQPGWLFNRDASTSSPFEFNMAEASIGTGSLYVEPIGVNASDKFIGENFLLTPVADVNSLSYDFQIGSGGSASDANHFYMNVYANFGESDPLKFYDCRYDVVPTVGSTSDFTTVTFDPTQAYPVDTRGSSPHTCPAVPADMDTLSPGSTLRVFSLNVGDTSANDVGLDGYLDNVVVDASGDVTTFDLDPYPVSGAITNPAADGDHVHGLINLTATYDDGDAVSDDAVQWAVRAGTCAAGIGTVFGNVDGHSDAYMWDGASFSASLDTFSLTSGNYCFVFNPTDDPGQANVRETRNFVVDAVAPSTKGDCKAGGWQNYFGLFGNQGECVAYVNHHDGRGQDDHRAH